MNKFKKILSVSLAAIMICSAITIGSVAETSTPIISGLDGKEEHTEGEVAYKVIDSKEDFVAATAENTNYILAKDIDMDGAVYSTKAGYALMLANGSTLDGNGCKITNFSITHGEAALISFAGTATVKNLQIGEDGALIPTLRGMFWSPANTNVTFENCDVYAKSNEAKTVGQQVAAFVGAASGDLTFKNCASYGEIYNNNYHAAGLVGRTTASVSFENCANYAKIENLENGKYTAGLLGTAQGSTNSSAIVSFKDCANYGKIESAGYNVGGISGCVEAASSVTYLRCLNFGNVSATGERAGGIAGHVGSDATFTDCSNYGSVTVPKVVGGINALTNSNVTYTGCENNGSVTATGILAGGILGGVFGENKVYTMTNCSNNGNVKGTDSVGGLLGGGEFSGTDAASTTKYNSLTIRNSRNGGAISGTQHVGGFVGFLHIGRDAAEHKDFVLSIYDSQNFGKVSASGARGGGFVGRYYDKHTGSEIKNCRNYGDVSAFNNAAGFVGEACHMTFDTCINYGDITGTASNADAAGICGWSNRSIAIKNCSNIGNIKGGQRVSQGTTGSSANSQEVSGFYAFGSMEGTLSGSNVGIFIGQNATFTGTGNKCTSSPTAYTNQSGVDSDSAVTAAAAISLLKARHGEIALTVGENGKLNLAGAALRATQATTAKDGKQRVRFIASTELESTLIEDAGFEIKIEYGSFSDDINYECDTLMSGFYANNGGVKVSYSATCVGGSYVFIGYVDDIPTTEGTVTFTVKPYVTDGDGNVTYGTAYTVVYNNGVFVSATPISA